MKRITKNIRKHKVVSCLVLGICLVGIIGIGAGYGLHQAKISNTQKALELAQDGYIDSEELATLTEDIALGEEIVTSDGSTVVVTKDDNGNLVTTTVKDSSGNSTGAVVPGGSEGGYYPAPSPSPNPAGHSHTWIAHYATRQIPQTQEVYHQAVTHKVSHDYCSACHRCIDDIDVCTCNGKLNGSYAMVETVVDQPAWTETVTTYVTEQYVDYYYCSECGERQ